MIWLLRSAISFGCLVFACVIGTLAKMLVNILLSGQSSWMSAYPVPFAIVGIMLWFIALVLMALSLLSWLIPEHELR